MYHMLSRDALPLAGEYSARHKNSYSACQWPQSSAGQQVAKWSCTAVGNEASWLAARLCQMMEKELGKATNEVVASLHPAPKV